MPPALWTRADSLRCGDSSARIREHTSQATLVIGLAAVKDDYFLWRVAVALLQLTSRARKLSFNRVSVMAPVMGATKPKPEIYVCFERANQLLSLL